LTKKLILISGPTGSGKSQLAVSLALKINGEIINADSMQIYNDFSVLSSRPTKKNLKKVQHHLYGFILADKYFSTGAWIKVAKKKIKECIKKGKVPIIVGGTGLYFNAITRGISKIPKINIQTRRKIRNLHKKIGNIKFYEKLLLIDPKVKDKILPSDTQRIIRAYEVIHKTKKSIFDWASTTKSDFLKYDIRKIFINIPRDILLNKIEKRTEKMFRDNCVDEVKVFLTKKLDSQLSINKLIGVKEIENNLKGIFSLEKSKELINIKTRQYAKRQNTWARGHMDNWKKLYSKDSYSLLKKVLKAVS
jgi:tRNA dimethylallyltransferase